MSERTNSEQSDSYVEIPMADVKPFDLTWRCAFCGHQVSNPPASGPSLGPCPKCHGGIWNTTVVIGGQI